MLQVSSQPKSLLHSKPKSTTAPSIGDTQPAAAPTIVTLHPPAIFVQPPIRSTFHSIPFQFQESATFEVALEWLCLILPPNELPLKFRSSNAVLPDEDGSVSIIPTTRDDWTPLEDSSVPTEMKSQKYQSRVKCSRKLIHWILSRSLKQIGSVNIWNNNKKRMNMSLGKMLW